MWLMCGWRDDGREVGGAGQAWSVSQRSIEIEIFEAGQEWRAATEGGRVV